MSAAGQRRVVYRFVHGASPQQAGVQVAHALAGDLDVFADDVAAEGGAPVLSCGYD